MSHCSRAARVALLVVLVCASIGGTATATTMMLEPAGEFTMASSGAVTFTGEGVELACNVTLEGRLEGTIANIEREGGTLGQVTEQRWAECSGGSLLAVLRLPLTIRIGRMLGTSSNFLGILYFIGGEAYEFSLINTRCLYAGTAGMLWGFSGSPARSTTVTDLGTTFTKVSGSAFCPLIIRRAGRFNISPTQVASFR